MKLPTNLKINSIPYKIKYVDEKVNKNEPSLQLGLTSFMDNSIALYRGKQTEKAIWSTLWHEVIHVILDAMQFGLSKEMEELFVEIIARGINSVMLDNGFLKE